MTAVERFLRPERRWPHALGIQAAAAQAGWQGVRLMLAYQALAVTGSPVFVGVVAAVFALAGLVVSIPSGRLIDRNGSARVATGGMVISIVGVVVGVASPTIAGTLGAAALAGIGQIYVVVAQQGLVARLTAGSPDAAFGTLTAAVSLGQLIGPPLVTAVAIAGAAAGEAHPHTQLGLACCGALLALGLPMFFVLRPAEAAAGTPRGRDAKTASLQELVQMAALRRALLVGATVIVTVDLLASFVPVWGVANGIPANVVGWLLAVRALFTIASRFGVVNLVARFGRKTLLLLTLGLTVLALVLLPFANAWIAVPIMAAIGIGLGMPQPLTLVWISSLAPPQATGAVFGARMTVNRLAQVTLPLLVATVAGPAGMFAVFWSTATILAGGIILVGLTRQASLDTPPPNRPAADPPNSTGPTSPTAPTQ